MCFNRALLPTETNKQETELRKIWTPKLIGHKSIFEYSKNNSQRRIKFAKLVNATIM